MLSWMLGGYLTGMMIGFVLFDPNLDLWALLSAVLTVVGLLAGLLPFFQRTARIVLGAVLGLYLSMLVATALFGDLNKDGYMEALRTQPQALATLAGAVLGGILAARAQRSIEWPLFGAVFGGFITPLLISPLLDVDMSKSGDLAPYVLIFGLIWGFFAWYQVRKLTPPSEMPIQHL